MTIPSPWKHRSLAAGLAVALAAGCESKQTPEIASPSTASPSPADGSLATMPPKSATKPPVGSSEGISNVEKDLRKDLGGGPLIKPDADVTTGRPAPPAQKAGEP